MEAFALHRPELPPTVKLKRRRQLIPYLAIFSALLLLGGLIMHGVFFIRAVDTLKTLYDTINESYSTNVAVMAIFYANIAVSVALVVIVFITAILLLHHETQVQWYRAGLLGGVEVPTLPCSKTSFAVFAAVILGVTMAAVVWFVVVMSLMAILSVLFYVLDRSAKLALSHAAERPAETEFLSPVSGGPPNAVSLDYLCPEWCLALGSFEFITSEQCICDPGTIEVVQTMSHSIMYNAELAYIGVAIAFIGCLLMAMRSAQAVAAIKSDMIHRQQMRPVLVSLEGGAKAFAGEGGGGPNTNGQLEKGDIHDVETIRQLNHSPSGAHGVELLRLNGRVSAQKLNIETTPSGRAIIETSPSGTSTTSRGSSQQRLAHPSGSSQGGGAAAPLLPVAASKAAAPAAQQPQPLQPPKVQGPPVRAAPAKTPSPRPQSAAASPPGSVQRPAAGVASTAATVVLGRRLRGMHAVPPHLVRRSHYEPEPALVGTTSPVLAALKGP